MTNLLLPLPEYDFTGRITPSPELVAKEAAAFAKYAAAEEAKRFRLKSRFGSSRHATLADAEAFAATLRESFTIEAL